MFSQLIYKYRKIIKPAVICVFCVAAFIFWSFSEGTALEAKKQYGEITQMRAGSQIANPQTMESILEKRDIEDEAVKYAAWTQSNSVSVGNSALGTSVGVENALVYYGDNYGIFNLILDNGCAFSKKTAFDVFGTTDDILGETVTINGEKYVLEKLLTGGKPAVIFKAGEESGTGFDAIDVIIGKGNPVSVSEIQMNYHIQGDIVIDYSSVIKSVRATAVLILWIALIAAVLSMLSGMTRNAGRTFRGAVLSCGALLMIGICYMSAGSPVYIPDSLVPTRWSEFEFWTNAIADYREAIGHYFFMKTYIPDSLFRAYMLKTLIFALLSAGGILVAAATLNKLVKERRINLGVDNIKQYYKTIREFRISGGK